MGYGVFGVGVVPEKKLRTDGGKAGKGIQSGGGRRKGGIRVDEQEVEWNGMREEGKRREMMGQNR